MFLLVGMCVMTLLHLLLCHCCDKITGKEDLRGKDQEFGEFGSQHEYWVSRNLWPLEERRFILSFSFRAF